MPIQPIQLIAPEGEIEEWMFADKDAMERAAAAYLNQGYAKVGDVDTDDQDTAAVAYAYYLHYDRLCNRMMFTPAKATLDSGKTEREYTAEQLKFAKDKRSFWLSQFEAHFSESSVGVAVGKINDPTPPGTVFI